MSQFLGLVIQNGRDEFLASAVRRDRELSILAWSPSPEFACRFRSPFPAFGVIREHEIKGATVFEMWDCGDHWEICELELWGSSEG